MLSLLVDLEFLCYGLNFIFLHLFWHTSSFNTQAPWKSQHKGVYRRTIEILQRGRIFKANCCLNVHNAHLKIVFPISG